MALTHEDKVKKKELEFAEFAKKITERLVADRKEKNTAILAILSELVELNPEIRFEQMLTSLIGKDLDFYREPSETLDIINQSVKVYGWKK